MRHLSQVTTNMKLLYRGFIQKSILLFLLQVVAILLYSMHQICQWQAAFKNETTVVVTKLMTTPKQPLERDRCAINLFGLPRAFRSLTLPSLIKNVIAVNADCDFFVRTRKGTRTSTSTQLTNYRSSSRTRVPSSMKPSKRDANGSI
jgi:hypothetical protein